MKGTHANARKHRSVYMNTSIFNNWSPANHGDATIVHDAQTGLQMAHVKTLPALFQAIGYAKYKNRDKCRIVYRGQTELYPKTDKKGNFLFLPTALRKISRQTTIEQVRARIKKEIEAFQNLDAAGKNPGNYSAEVIEAVLQQYGMPSTWIDAVDNIWIALWFACYQAKSTFRVEVNETPDAMPSGKNQNEAKRTRNFIHMVRRSPRAEKPSQRFAFILLLEGEELASKDDSKKEKEENNSPSENNKDENNKVEMIDLRKELASHYIRPHAQHGLLVRTQNSENMASLIKGIIRIDLEDALEWLGEGRILLPESIISPPNYDTGFQWLLENEKTITEPSKHCFPIYC